MKFLGLGDQEPSSRLYSDSRKIGLAMDIGESRRAKDAIVGGAGAQGGAFRQSKIYDLLTATPLLAWYGFCLTQQLPSLVLDIATFNDSAANISTLSSVACKIATASFITVLAVLLTLRRSARGRLSGHFPQFAAVAGTYLGIAIVLLPARELPPALAIASALLILCGTTLAIYVALSLGRSLSMLRQARKLVTSGPYRLVRHPLYACEAIALFGITVQYFSPVALALLALQCAFQLERMKYEEDVLTRTFPEYRDYMAATARIVPGLY